MTGWAAAWKRGPLVRSPETGVPPLGCCSSSVVLLVAVSPAVRAGPLFVLSVATSGQIILGHYLRSLPSSKS